MPSSLSTKILSAALFLYLVTHGVSVPSGAEPGELARYAWGFAFGWLRLRS